MALISNDPARKLPLPARVSSVATAEDGKKAPKTTSVASRLKSRRREILAN